MPDPRDDDNLFWSIGTLLILIALGLTILAVLT